MNLTQPRRISRGAACILTLTGLALSPVFAVLPHPSLVPTAPFCAHTPGRGSAERRAIADAMRRDVRAFASREVVFVFDSLKVNGNWAYAIARPQSPDGNTHLEDYQALLRRSHGWRVVGRVLGGEDDSPSAQLRRLRTKYPRAPRDIFPN